MSHESLSATSRVGRENQLFNDKGARLVAGCVVLNSTYDQVLLISSSAKKNKWVLPKGGIETDEAEDYSKTAIRETWEEAGVTGELIGQLPVVEDLRPPKEWGKLTNDKILNNPPRSEFHFYEMLVEKFHDIYPESKERKRKWFSFQEAIDELNGNKRPELVEILKNSRIKKK
ncbi:hypothetical protein WICMUC_001803 [Wickerhamomyces mucosus]|uniref:Nudix hydrolase domain-containing protein n=1 Tax=Wickerhamomyces mucosus TaxID=1378264 RepID=A0A9P8PRY6_9ASCO|nr:hypothetical protein WICMUC_001803 [Wickerhamomyces mucosus]